MNSSERNPSRLDRRQWIGASSAAVAAFAVASPRAAWAAPKFEVESPATISRNGDFYHGWPTVARRPNGELLAVYSGGREGHVCPFGRVELIRSHDDGKTWTWPEVILDGPIDDRDAGVYVTAKGTILVTTFTSLAYDDSILASTAKRKSFSKDRLARWLAAHERVDEAARRRIQDVWMIRSTDGGESWSQRYSTIVNSPHGPTQLSDGRLLYAGKELWQTDKRIGACQSTDDGQTWKWLAAIPTRDGDDRQAYHELHAVEASDGRIVAQIRNHNKANHYETLQCHSTDGGKSWSTPQSIGVWGYPSHLMRLADGRLLMTYGHRRKPFGIQARLSDNHGETWSEPIMLVDDSLSTDLGYPSTTQLADGSLVSVWYEKVKDVPKAALRSMRWKLID